jgi:hypothetical protein
MDCRVLTFDWSEALTTIVSCRRLTPYICRDEQESRLILRES